jgi:hypothetical protein
MNILCMSDTHGKHHDIPKEWLVEADMVIHCGDFTANNSSDSFIDFIVWFHNLNYASKILIAGNHDFILDYHYNSEKDVDVSKALVKSLSISYLHDSNAEETKIYGSPWVRRLPRWAFHLPDDAAKEQWDTLPFGLDILITHGPAYGMNDLLHPKFLRPGEDQHSGDKELAERILQIKPKYHLHGHIHEAYGVHYNEGTTHINCSLLDENYQLKNKPILIEI